MSLAPEPGLRLHDPGSCGHQPADQARTLEGRRPPTAVAAVESEDATEIQVRRLLLRAIDTYDSHNGAGPTVPELANYLGIAPEFGHDNLVRRLQRELSLGHVSQYGGRFRLTQVGSHLAESEAPTAQEA